MHTILGNPTVDGLTFDEALNSVEKTQKNFAKYTRRSREEFTTVVVDGYRFAKDAEANMSAEDRGKLFSRFQIFAATGETSIFTPYIKLIFGEHDKDGKEVEFLGEKHTKWVPNASYGRYFNLYEFIDANYDGEAAGLNKWVLDKGGPATIVAKVLADKREADAPKEETLKERRELYLAETAMPPVDMPFKLPEGAAEYIGAILQKTPEGYRMVGISKKDATADFDKLAASQTEALTKARETREAEERGKAKAEEENAAKAGLSVEEWRAKVIELQQSIVKPATAALPQSDDNQAAG